MPCGRATTLPPPTRALPKSASPGPRAQFERGSSFQQAASSASILSVAASPSATASCSVMRRVTRMSGVTRYGEPLLGDQRDQLGRIERRVVAQVQRHALRASPRSRARAAAAARS